MNDCGRAAGVTKTRWNSVCAESDAAETGGVLKTRPAEFEAELYVEVLVGPPEAAVGERASRKSEAVESEGSVDRLVSKRAKSGPEP